MAFVQNIPRAQNEVFVRCTPHHWMLRCCIRYADPNIRHTCVCVCVCLPHTEPGARAHTPECM